MNYQPAVVFTKEFRVIGIKRPHILIYAKEFPFILKTIDAAFKGKIYDTCGVTTIEKAIEKLRDGGSDLMIIDTLLLAEKGAEKIKKLKKISPDTKFLLLVGKGDVFVSVNPSPVGRNSLCRLNEIKDVLF